jgi:uncharacterized membrane protein YjgN (DUF898 family)
VPSDEILTQPPNVVATPVPSQTTGSPAHGSEEALNLSWMQPPGMIGLCIKNFLLKIVTLGIYGFWGKTEVRRRIWSSARLNGEPLHYTGTGKELFLGFLIVFGVFFVPVLVAGMVVALWAGPGSRLLAVFQFVVYVVSFFLIGAAIHRAQRYRLSRTNWRGIRGGLDGSSTSYAWTHFWTGLLIILSLGWASPWRSTKLQGLITNGIRFGDRPFRFAATAGPLYKPFAILWTSGLVIFALAWVTGTGLVVYLWTNGALAMPRPGQPPDVTQVMMLVAILYGTVLVGFLAYGVISAWYRAKMMNHFAAHTTFENARFKGNATGRSLIWLTITNWLMILLTLGLLSPVAQMRSARYLVRRLAIDGSAPLAEIAQRAHDDLKRGEGLAQVFDVDAF